NQIRLLTITKNMGQGTGKSTISRNIERFKSAKVADMGKVLTFTDGLRIEQIEKLSRKAMKYPTSNG
ncbi:MAG: hypothetical protein ACKO0V_13215, partial [bacterium]